MRTTFLFISLICLLLVSVSCKKENYETNSLFYYPSCFTPNGDGLNDKWTPLSGIKHVNGETYTDFVLDADSYLLQVFNNNNKKIFESNSLNLGWDGTYKDNDCPADYYHFLCIYSSLEGKKYRDSGVFELLR